MDINIYKLMHKNDKVGNIMLSDDDKFLINVKIENPELAPFLGNATVENMRNWWNNRSIPGTRKDLNIILENAQCKNAGELMAKNLALSLSDCYWISPIEVNLSWQEVNLYKEHFTNKLNIYRDKYTPNPTLSGQMDKYWITENEKNYLIKKSEIAYGQQNINELVATKLHEVQNFNNHVKYETILKDGKCIGSKSEAYTNENIESISAYQVIQSKKISNDMSFYEGLIRICAENGLNEKEVRKFLDYETMSDLWIGNTDRHLMNIEILRDSNTLKFIGMAPIFDTGNSLYWDISRTLTKKEHIGQKINSFASTSGKSLKYVKNKEIFNMSKVLTPDNIYNIFKENGVPEGRIDEILKNHETRHKLLENFIEGEKDKVKV